MLLSSCTFPWRDEYYNVECYRKFITEIKTFRNTTKKKYKAAAYQKVICLKTLRKYSMCIDFCISSSVPQIAQLSHFSDVDHPENNNKKSKLVTEKWI